MKKKQSGLTLLEAVCAILLFALLLQMLLNFFSTVYANAKLLERKSYLMDNARTVNNYIKEKVRETDNVKIIVEDGISIKEINPIADDVDNVAVEGALKSIEYKEGTNTIAIKMTPISSAEQTQGTYKLSYCSGGTETLISDQIESITVSRDVNSDYVTFTCQYLHQGSLAGKERVTDTFTISLAYKTKVS